MYNMARQKGALLLLCLTVSAVRAAPKILPDPSWEALASYPAYTSFSPANFPSSNSLLGFYEDYSLNSEVPNYAVPSAVYGKSTKKVEKSKKASKVYDDNVFYRKRRSTVNPAVDTVASNKLSEQKAGIETPREQLPFMYDTTKMNPIVDVAAQRKAFLDALFTNIVNAQPAVPVPQATMMPPTYWVPTSISIDPIEYNKKLNDFIKKLVDKLTINLVPVTITTTEATKTNDNETQATKIARSTEEMSSFAAAKDSIVDSILTDLGIIKSDMVSTVDDLIAYGKTATVSPLIAGKPLKPFMSSMWMKPTADPMLPFKQRIMILSKMFDMLTDLQRNVTANIVKGMQASMDTLETSEAMDENNLPPTFHSGMLPQDEAALNFNMTLLDAIKKRLSDITIAKPFTYMPSDFEEQLATMQREQVPTETIKTIRAVPNSRKSFWVAYPTQQSTQDIPMAAALKREVPNFGAEASIDPIMQSDLDQIRHQYARAVSMKMHQGYQSLPAGASESVQAGGGSVPGHQGGGINLFDANDYEDFDQWADWEQYLKNEHQKYRHHHNRH